MQSDLMQRHFQPVRGVYAGALLTVVVATLSTSPLRSKESSLAARLQLQVNRAMEKVQGAMVVVDVANRSVLAAYRMDLASRQLDAPGSTLKPFLLMSLLESGRLDPNQQLICRKPLRIGTAQMDCTHPSQVKELDASSAIAYSCNSYVAEVALRLNGAELAELLRRAGFDSPTSLVDHEARGRIDTPSAQEDLQLEALGYRGIEVTPLELLEAYRQLALRRRQNDLGVDAPVFHGLEDSVAFGMAHAAFVDGMKIAGKTGTSVAHNTQQTHGYFVAYAPAEKPQIVLVVYLAQGRGLDAAAVAQPVLQAFAQFRDKS
jgi:cell division protein FtsI/penicillin-binding protein 2